MGKNKKDDKEDKEAEKPIVARTIVDVQRLKLMKLMKNPDKPVLLPDRPKSKTTPSVPEFVRNVMGSSAGAGSGEFHVYRHLRRKEYARQKFIQEKSKKELLDEEYQQKIEDNKKKAEDLTAKKRAKRLRRKAKQKQNKKLKTSKKDEPIETTQMPSDDDDDDSDGGTQTPIQEVTNTENDSKNSECILQPSHHPPELEKSEEDNSPKN